MTFLKRILFRLRSFLRRQQSENDLDEELRYHLTMTIEEYQAKGMSPKEASKLALSEFGGVEQIKEGCRDAWGTRVIMDLIRDVRYSVRSLWKHKGFTVVAVATLALGIGANIALFSIANAIMLRSLPVKNPEELRWLTWKGKPQNIGGHGWSTGDGNVSISSSFAYPTFEQFRQYAEEAQIFGLKRIPEKTLGISGKAFSANGYSVSENFFQGLGVSASIGRVFADSEDGSEGSFSAVISHSLWQRVFGAQPDVLGQSLTIEGQVFRVAGVLPPGFRGPIRGYMGEFYIPFAAFLQIQDELRWTQKRFFWMEIMLRLRDQDSEPRAMNSLQSIMERATDERFLRDPEQPLRVVLHDGRAGLAYGFEPLSSPLHPLLGAAGVVLFIACANLAGLMLARGASREHQASVEAALGASRWQLMRRPFLESLLVAFAGATLGLGLALWSKGVLVSLLWPGGLPMNFGSDARVFIFTFAITVATALLFGFLPAWRLSKADSNSSLKTRSAMGLPRLRLGRALVSIQVGLSLVLLVGGGLFARSLYQLSQVETGFAHESLLAFPSNASSAGYEGLRRIAYYEEARAKLERLPGISSVSLGSKQLMSGKSSVTGTRKPGSHPEDDNDAIPTYTLRVGETFLRTMDLSLLRGRSFLPTDTEKSEKVVIINRRLAQAAFHEESVIGRALRIIGDGEYRVVGVCEDFKYEGLRGTHSIALFPYRQYPNSKDKMIFYARADVEPRGLISSIRKTMAAHDPMVPLPYIKTLSKQIEESSGEDRASAFASAGLASLALLLACIGLYGLMAYNIGRRTNEIGIRIALGATRRGVMVPLLKQAGWMAGVGIAGGLVVALGLAQLISDRLFGVEPFDMTTFVLAALTLLGVTLFAAWIPARNATKIDPLEALRAE